MSHSHLPAVQRVHPPKAPYRIINPVVRWMLSTPRRGSRIGEHLLVLHLSGRTSGRRLDVPVAFRAVGDGRFLVLTNSVWRVNLRGRPDVDITLHGERRAARAELVQDPATVAEVYQALIRENGHTKAGRRMGIRINVDRVPTHDELEEATRREGLSLVYITLVDPPR